MTALNGVELGAQSPLLTAGGKKRNFMPTEHDDQCALVELLVGPIEKGERVPGAGMTIRWPELALLYAVPNGGHRHPATAGKLKAEGARADVPDLCLPVARGPFHALYVEMKRRKGGTVTPGQKRYQASLVAQGYAVFTCYGVEEGLACFLAYLKLSSFDWRQSVSQRTAEMLELIDRARPR